MQQINKYTRAVVFYILAFYRRFGMVCRVYAAYNVIDNESAAKNWLKWC